MKVAAYIRVSTHMQVEEGYSLSAQKERLKAFAYSQGWEIVQFFVDEGISAKDMDRPELQRMLKGVREEMFDIVLVYKLDRLTRSVIDLDKLLTEFSKHNVMFKSSTEVYDTTTATGRLFIRLVASMAQWERENLGERIRMGMEQKAQEGKWVINRIPFGYSRVEGDFLEIVEQEAIIVRKIFELYLSGKYGVGKIAKMLNDRKYKTKSGANWGFNSVHYILTNPLYTGTMRYNYRMNKEQYFEIDGAVPEIIKEADFNLVQETLKRRSTSHPKKATSPYIFTSVLKCSRCGGNMDGHQSQSKRKDKTYISYSYYCKNKRFGTCDQSNIAQNYLESQFIKLIEDWIVNKDVAAEIATSADMSTDNSKQIEAIHKELAELEKRRAKWQYAWVNEMLSDEDLSKRTQEENEKEKMLLEELGTLGATIKNELNGQILIEVLTNLQANWTNLTVHEKKQFVNIAVNTMTVDKVEKRQRPESVKITDIQFN